MKTVGSSNDGHYYFSFQGSGRCGTIACSKRDQRMEIEWEFSGSPNYDILLAPMDLQHWSSGLDIPWEEQKVILNGIREWLVGNRARADIAASTTTKTC